ncbi:hypothetical protein F5146DRAFT_1176076, partial [Armillaria mellea]
MWNGQDTTGEDDIELSEEIHPLPMPYYASHAKTRFGMKKREFRQGNDMFNYEDKYPEDPIYHETAPNARVWRTYADESAIFDANMVEDSRDNVDVLLVFAGLFSAVVSTFVTQASQSLSADYTQMSASFLFELVAIQRALASGATVDTVGASPYDPSSTFVPSTGNIWVNGLWFTSLVLSLTTALVAVLVKQWLHYYIALPSGTPRERIHVRQFRYMGFQKWHVLIIVGLLPVLMHTALAIFFVGLVVFLIPLQVSLSWIVGSISIIVYAAYVITTILPIISLQCPYRTPLSDLIYVTYTYITRQVISCFHFSLDSTSENTISTMMHDAPAPREMNTLKRLESEAVKAISDDLSVEALHWL